MTTKQERVDQANELIKIIGSHGRKFFFNKEENRFAKFELRNSRVYFIDDYKAVAVYIDNRDHWRGFSHGGTLRALVLDMREYIVNKVPVPRWKIVIQQLGKSDLTGNIWGYDVESAQAVRDAGWSTFRAMLQYKSHQAGVLFEEVNEAYSTVTCSACGSRSGPSGLKDLRIREWSCTECGMHHDRDVNAAKNILTRGLASLEEGACHDK